MINLIIDIWNYGKNRHLLLKRALFFSFLRSFIAITQFTALITAIYTFQGTINYYTGLIYIFIMTILCISGVFVTNYLEQKNSVLFGFTSAYDKRMLIGQNLKNIPLGYFNDISSGKISATLTSTLSNLELVVSMYIITIVSGIFNSISLLIFMFFYDYIIALITLLGIMIYFFMVFYQIKVSLKYAPVMQQSYRKFSESLYDFLQGIKVIKSYNYSNGDKNIKDAVTETCSNSLFVTNKSMPTQYLGGIIIALFESLLLVFAVFISYKNNDINTVKSIILIIYSFMIYISIKQAGSMLSMIGILESGIKEVYDIENIEQIYKDSIEKKPASTEIIIENVSFAYNNKKILNNISTTIKPNSLTAIIGPSGSGKTTLCHLIAGYHNLTSGNILIGGVDIRQINDKILMENISMVFQNVYLFEDTILNNIRFGKPNASIEEVQTACKKANCDEFIMNLKDGYNTLIKEGGVNLSGGEKQRIAIARAILKDAPIIVLDEATSALDVDNEYEIIKAIESLTKDKTVIIIAHRLKTVEKADHIIAIKSGEIVQEGTHNQLKNQSGIYKDFLLSRKYVSQWKVEI